MPKQYKALDIAKFIMAFFIIAIHADPVNSEVMRCIYTVAVPFFFSVSSFLFFRCQNSFLKYTRRIGLLYLIWLFIEAGVVYSRFFQNAPFGMGMLKFLHALVLTNTFWESWYLVASIEAMGLCVWLSRWMNNIVLFFLGILLYIPPLLYSAYYGNIPADGQVFLSKLYTMLPITNCFIIAFIFIVIGKIIAEERRTLSLWEGIIFISIAMFLWLVEINYQIPHLHAHKAFIMLPLIVALLLIILKDRRFNSIPLGEVTCKLMRNSSTLIYLSHPLFISLIARLTNLRNTPISYVLVAFCSCVFAIMVVRASKYWRFLRMLY